MLARFYPIKKWLRRFVYVNPVVFKKRVRLGRQSSKIFSDSTCLRLSYFHEKCLQPLQCALSPQYELENAVFEVTIMKGGASVILERQLRHSSRIEAHRRMREKINFSPFHFRHSE